MGPPIQLVELPRAGAIQSNPLGIRRRTPVRDIEVETWESEAETSRSRSLNTGYTEEAQSSERMNWVY